MPSIAVLAFLRSPLSFYLSVYSAPILTSRFFISYTNIAYTSLIWLAAALLSSKGSAEFRDRLCSKSCDRSLVNEVLLMLSTSSSIMNEMLAWLDKCCEDCSLLIGEGMGAGKGCCCSTVSSLIGESIVRVGVLEVVASTNSYSWYSGLLCIVVMWS